METQRISGSVVVILVLGSLSIAAAQQSGPQPAEAIEIDCGFVIFEGRYLPHPYMLRTKDGKTYINSFEVSSSRRGLVRRRGFKMRQMNQRPMMKDIESIEQHLRQDGMLVCTPNVPTTFLPVEQAIAIFDILLADKSRDAKLQALLQVLPPSSAQEDLALLVDTFDPPEGFGSRLQVLKNEQAEINLVNARHERYWTFLYALKMTGFALAVWALGTLLSCRPPLRRGWTGMNPSRVCSRQVVWLVILIVVLNVYDLLCTLFASSAGGLWELNPLAGEVVDNMAMIVTFKIALTVGAAILLLVMRHHRLAQIGSWWASVLYTVLMVRWATFNSVLM
jgi:hypothetical protein